MKYRRLPVIIEAVLWFKNGDHPNDYDGKPKEAIKEKWEGGIVRYFRNPEISGSQECKNCKKVMVSHGWIDTLEGGHIVCPGDWIITGVKGEHYPCKPDIFEKIYEKFEDK